MWNDSRLNETSVFVYFSQLPKLEFSLHLCCNKVISLVNSVSRLTFEVKSTKVVMYYMQCSNPCVGATAVSTSQPTVNVSRYHGYGYHKYLFLLAQQQEGIIIKR